jgi:hypothetical protein
VGLIIDYSIISLLLSIRLQSENVFTTSVLSCTHVFPYYRPQFIDSIESPEFQEWAVQLNGIWRQLGRQVKLWEEEGGREGGREGGELTFLL